MNEWDLLTQLLGGQTSLPKSRYIFRENPFAQSPMDGLGLNLPLDIGSLQTSQPLLEISGLQFNQPAVFDPSEAIRRIDQTNANLQAAISASSQPAAEPNKWEKFKNFMGQYGPLIFAGLGALTGDVMYGSAAQNWLNAKEMERQRKLQEQQIAEEQRRWQLAQDLANEERLYRRYRDQVSDNRAAEDMAWKREWMADERDYNRWRDVVQDERYADETAYRRSRDQIQDERYWDAVNYERKLSPLDEARIKHLNAQTWRIYNPLQDNNKNTEFNFWSQFGFRNQNEATKFASDLERAYDLEAKRNGGKYVEDFNGEGRWVFPKGKATPSLNNWISKTYGPETLRRYLAVKTGNPEYLDMTRSLTGLQTPGLIRDEWDLAADQLVTQFGSYQMALKYAKDNNYDQRLIAALERRARILQSRKKK